MGKLCPSTSGERPAGSRDERVPTTTAALQKIWAPIVSDVGRELLKTPITLKNMTGCRFPWVKWRQAKIECVFAGLDRKLRILSPSDRGVRVGKPTSNCTKSGGMPSTYCAYKAYERAKGPLGCSSRGRRISPRSPGKRRSPDERQSVHGAAGCHLPGEHTKPMKGLRERRGVAVVGGEFVPAHPQSEDPQTFVKAYAEQRDPIPHVSIQSLRKG